MTWVLVSVLGFIAEAYLIVALGCRITGAYDPWADEAGSAPGANDPWDRSSGTTGTSDDEPRAATRSF